MNQIGVEVWWWSFRRWLKDQWNRVHIDYIVLVVVIEVEEVEVVALITITTIIVIEWKC